ncbi:N-6 DNA methylase [Prosthecobacter algae]|uniref:site-specific DNA-methyltransferase (adenine-specific) n=1 Tax=Prosthecobacter algae TaxID=1144682 RepID=A0ABP9P6F1_9BACT
MPAPEIIRSLEAHKRWLGYLQPDGLVVSAAALVDKGHYYQEAQRQRQIELIDHLSTAQSYDEETGTVEVTDFKAFAIDFLQWPAQEWVNAADLPDSCHILLKESTEVLAPFAALHLPRSQREQLSADQSPFQLLLYPSGHPEGEFDKVYENQANTWETTATRRLERLLRETGIPIGLLYSKSAIRLVYAPKGENPGHLTFRYADMLSTMGRPILGALDLLLGRPMLFLGDARNQLPALLQHSRTMQASVSTALAEQVLESLYELVRGFQAADARVHGDLLRGPMARDPDEVYHGLLTVLLRLVFLLFAEDRGLLPSSSLFNQHYSLHALFERLRRDAALHHDTMDQRFGSWPQILTLSRLIHSGCYHRDLAMPARLGHLFDPQRFPFLEGRSDDRSDVRDPAHSLPTVSDGTLYRVLEKLLILQGERLSYRTLDVEQIGSVYQTMIGFTLEIAQGTSIALKPAKSKGVPAFLDLDALLAAEPGKRAEQLQKTTDHKITGKAATALKDALSHDDLIAALERKIAHAASPEKAPPGSLILQPTDERRRSGSHYTPRALTAPIVKKTLEPILARLGDKPTPQQILDLKVCDPAVGSGAFLVEGCRQLGDALVSAWQHYGDRPVIPPDEDELLHARRLVAQRCLYGVDRNPMATDLAKLSLWLATLAKDHPFTFLDHSLRSGDALVGLSKKQIIAFHWDLSSDQAKQRQLGEDQLEKSIEVAINKRIGILEGGDHMLPGFKAELLQAADTALEKARRTGDLCVAAFFNGDKPRARAELRDRYLDTLIEIASTKDAKENFTKTNEVKAIVAQLRQGAPHPVLPFHWEIEFPEIFARGNAGFDAFVGNPPYAGKNTISAGNADNYAPFLQHQHLNSHGNADLAAHFFRRAYNHVREHGNVGFVTTNTIGQGDTRESGLAWLCTKASPNAEIYSAERRIKWPGIAAVTVSTVHLHRGIFTGDRYLDGKKTSFISAYLFHGGSHNSPETLIENSTLSFQGAIPLGNGFFFDDTKVDKGSWPVSLMHHLLDRTPVNGSVVLPYIGGSELLNNPTHTPHRHVIYFGGMSEESARQFSDLFALIEERVKPERETNNRESRKLNWWRFGELATKMFEAKASYKTQLAHSFGPFTHLAFCRIPANIIIGGPHVCILDRGNAQFACLQSRVHMTWVQMMSSSFQDGLRYTPSDCFETFPFPVGWETDSALEAAGQAYYEFRAELLVTNSEGLTSTYNRFHDPEETAPGILRLRELHTAMDHAVLTAYGWSDLMETGRTVCDFIPDYYDEPEEEGGDPVPKSIRYRWPDATRDEVLARLLKLNAERHAQEVRQGLHSSTAQKAAQKTPAKKATQKAAKKEVPKQPASNQEDTPRLAQASLQFGPEDLALFQAPVVPDGRRPPSAPRIKESDPNIYATALVAALLHEAQGPLPWKRLRDSYILATIPRLMASHALPDDRQRVESWRKTWDQVAGPEHLLQALINLGGRKLAVEERPSGEPVFQLQDGFVMNPEPHVCYDAWLALRISEPFAEEVELELEEFDLAQLDQKVFALAA